MKNLFDVTKKTWSSYGDSEPHWSVLTDEKFKPSKIENNLNDFFNSGKNLVARFENILNRYDMSFEEKHVLEFGCGVGRILKAVAEKNAKVYGIDISEPHLKLAKENVTEGEFYLLNTHNQLPKVSVRPDIIISYITLQHNHPKYIVVYTGLLLNLLKNDGIAFLHIPHHIDNYDSMNKNENVMQMHFIPKQKVRAFVSEKNCTILEEIDSPQGPGVHSTIYVIKK